MKEIFQPGDCRYFEKVVTEADTATFASGNVHPVYATFALARDAEWACRLFVLEMKEADEEGIGTQLMIEHLAPALLNDKVVFEAKVKRLTDHEIICSFEARVGERIVAVGETGQKVLKKEKLNRIMQSLNRSQA